MAEAKKKTGLITGITGQDGSYLAELLLKKNYRVIGLLRKTSHEEPNNAAHLKGEIEFGRGDLTDSVSLIDAMRNYEPDEVYNLASQSYPGESWRIPIQTGDVTGLGAQRLFEAIKQAKLPCKIYQASSSEMFGIPREIPQDEDTPFNPANPYAAAKLYAHSIAKIYRQSFKMFIVCGILFNHESPRRGIGFVTQKVAYGAACAKLGIKSSPILNEQSEPIVKNGKLAMGNLDAKRDWGFAADFVEAMWQMMQQTKPDDFVIATGVARSVRDLCDEAFSYVGLDYKKYVIVDQRLVRPSETGPLVGDFSKAKKVLGWKPKTTFKQLIALMVDANLAKLK